MTDYNPKIEDVVNVIQDLNDEISEQWNPYVKFQMPLFNFQSDGAAFIVEFMGIELFGEEDDRKYNEEKDNYEDFKEYLKRRAFELIAEVSKIKLS